MHFSLTNRTPSALSSRRFGAARREVKGLGAIPVRAGMSAVADKSHVEKASHRSKKSKTREATMEFVKKYMVLPMGEGGKVARLEFAEWKDVTGGGIGSNEKRLRNFAARALHVGLRK